MNDNKKIYNIVVNARQVEVDHKKLTFDEIVIIAFGSYTPSDMIIYTVTYSKGENGKEGTLVAGQTINVKDGMVFNVTQTNKS